MTYPEALNYLESLAPRGWRLGLDRMNEFVRRADLTSAIGPLAPKFIHVAGTNGKGSVTAFVQSMLVETGYWTGAFFSPYVYDTRERIQFNRNYIPEPVFAMLTQLLRPIAESLTYTEFGGITEFEFKTGLGFAFWKQLECEWVALETGLGGRLDATNVITPATCIITSIALDHMSVLGHSVEEIAGEKAGIIKAGAPVIVGELPLGAVGVVEAAAAELGAPIWRFGQEIVLEHAAISGSYHVTTPTASHRDLEPGLLGVRQPHNMALAVAAMDASGAGRTLRGYADGCLRASVPGRYEKRTYRGVPFILDGAHNPDAARFLVESLRKYEPGVKRIVLLTGMVAGHDPADFFREFQGVVTSAHIAPIDFHRAVPPAELEPVVQSFIPRAESHETALEALTAALDDAALEGLVLVTGSFYLVGEIGRSML